MQTTTMTRDQAAIAPDATGASTETLLAQIKADLKQMTEVGGDIVAARVHELVSPLKRATLFVLLGSILAVFGLADAVRWLVSLALARGDAPDLLRDQLGWSALVMFVISGVLFFLARNAVTKRVRKVAREVTKDVDDVNRGMARMMHSPA